MPTCKSELDCLQDIDDHIFRLDDRIRDIFSVISLRSDTTSGLLIPILVILSVVLLCVIIITYLLSRRERVRFIDSTQLNARSLSTEVLVN